MIFCQNEDRQRVSSQALNYESSVPEKEANKPVESVLIEDVPEVEVGSPVSKSEIPLLSQKSGIPAADTTEKDESLVEKIHLPVKPKQIPPSSESGNPQMGLPEKEGDPEKKNFDVVTSNQAALVSELGLDVKGVAQDAPSAADSPRVAALPPVNHQTLESTDSDPRADPVEGGPSCSNSVAMFSLDHDSAHLSSPRDTAHPEAQTIASPSLEPKVQTHEENVLSSSSSGVLDNWVLSERIAVKKNEKPHLPPTGLFFNRSPSWIDDGEDSGPAFPQNEGSFGNHLEVGQWDDAASDVSTYSEYREIDDEFEDDFTVHPPRKWNSTNNLEQMHLPPRMSPPVTRSKGIKLGKGKNKLRW